MRKTFIGNFSFAGFLFLMDATESRRDFDSARAENKVSSQFLLSSNGKIFFCVSRRGEIERIAKKMQVLGHPLQFTSYHVCHHIVENTNIIMHHQGFQEYGALKLSILC